MNDIEYDVGDYVLFRRELQTVVAFDHGHVETGRIVTQIPAVVVKRYRHGRSDGGHFYTYNLAASMVLGAGRGWEYAWYLNPMKCGPRREDGTF